MSKNILNQRDIRESYFFRCVKCGREVFGDFRDERQDICDTCKKKLDEQNKDNIAISQ